MKREYEMTGEDHAALLDAGKPVPAMYLSGGMPMYSSPQENANEAWRKLGLKMGFDHMTVEPISGKPTTFFRAEPAPDPLIPDFTKENQYEFECGSCHGRFLGHKGRCICDACKARSAALREIYEKECASRKLLASDPQSVAYQPVAAALLAAFEAGRKDCEIEMEAAGFRQP